MKQTFITVIVLFFILYGYIYLNRYEITPKQRELFAKRALEPFDTLIARFVSNTGSLDLCYFQGTLSFPKDIKVQLFDTLTRDIRICGNFPKDFIDMTSWNYDSELLFQIVGKVIAAENEYQSQKVPLFYVTAWEKFNYDRDMWIEKGDLNIYPHRAEMVKDMLKYMKFEGESIQEIVLILGVPDYKSTNEIGYRISENYGFDIDPIASKRLKIVFNEDSMVINKRIDEWEK